MTPMGTPWVCWSMKRTLVWLVICGLLTMYAGQVHAAEEQLGEDLMVDYSPDSLELRPGERGKITIEFTNVGDEAYFIGLEYMIVETPGGPRGTFSGSYFQLQPGASKKVICEVESNARLGQDPDVSDATIKVLWGPELTGTDGEHPNFNNEAHREYIEVDVVDDFGLTYFMWIAILAVLTIVAVFGAFIIRRRMEVTKDSSPPVGE